MTEGDLRSKWEKALTGKNMTDVLNTMLEIADQGDDKVIPLLEIAACNVHPLAKKIPIPTKDGEFTFEEFRARCIGAIRSRHDSAELPDDTVSAQNAM